MAILLTNRSDVVLSDPDILRTNSAPNVSAQISGLCLEASKWDPGARVVGDIVTRCGQLPQALLAIVYIQAKSGARISEVLKIRNWDMNKRGLVTIQGLKGSKDRLVDASLIMPVLSEWQEKGYNPFRQYSRFQVYRWYKKIGLTGVKQGKNRKATTHIFRYLMARDLQDEGHKLEQISEMLGHKDSDNTQNYLQYGS